MPIKTPIQVLLVIRNVELRQLYHELFIVNGWEVLVSDNAADALLNLIVYSQVQLIVVDVPSLTREVERLIAIIGHNARWRFIPVILMNVAIENPELAENLKRLVHVVKIETQRLSPKEFIGVAVKAVEKRVTPSN